jgi:hypothetical protein
MRLLPAVRRLSQPREEHPEPSPNGIPPAGVLSRLQHGVQLGPPDEHVLDRRVAQEGIHGQAVSVTTASAPNGTPNTCRAYSRKAPCRTSHPAWPMCPCKSGGPCPPSIGRAAGAAARPGQCLGHRRRCAIRPPPRSAAWSGCCAPKAAGPGAAASGSPASCSWSARCPADACAACRGR